MRSLFLSFWMAAFAIVAALGGCNPSETDLSCFEAGGSQAGTIADESITTIDATRCSWVATAVSQQINVIVEDTDATEGRLLFVSRDPEGSHSVVFKRSDSTGAIVSLPGSKATGAILIFRGAQWRLLFAGAGALPGAAA